MFDSLGFGLVSEGVELDLELTSGSELQGGSAAKEKDEVVNGKGKCKWQMANGKWQMAVRVGGKE